MKSWSSLSGAVNFWLIAESGPAPCCTDHWVKLQKVLPWVGLPKLHCAGFILLGWWSATNVCHSDLIFRLLLWSWRTTETPLRIICLPIMQHSRHPCSSGIAEKGIPLHLQPAMTEGQTLSISKWFLEIHLEIMLHVMICNKKNFIWKIQME